MTDSVTPKTRPNIPVFYDPGQFQLHEKDCDLFSKELRSFVPPDVFDVHAHWYDMRIFAPATQVEDFDGPTWVGYETYTTALGRWQGDRAPRRGLFFPMPARGLNIDTANRQIIKEASRHPDSRVLIMVTPSCDPAVVEQQIKNRSVAGFKVYHLFAARTDTFNATPDEFIPEWVWELSNRHRLCIMLHMVMSRSLAEPENQRYIVDRCRRYPQAKLILAHAARGFCGRHTSEGIDSLRGLGNVYFDMSVACEAEAMEAILATFGPTRLMYGTDFPISEGRGRAMNLGDGFYWLYEKDLPRPAADQVTLIGIESLLALKQACHSLHLNDSDVERIFRINAEELVGLSSPPSGESGSGQTLYRQAKLRIPGGTQLVSKRPEQYAPDKWPAYFREARGCEVIDLDGRRYLDFATSGIGACLLGYAHPAVTNAVLRRIQLGSMSTLNSPEEVELASLLLSMHPWAESMRLARSGGEALSVAVRIARASTGREVIAFCGYHGWSDWYLAANLGADDSLAGHLLTGLNPSGVPQSLRGTALPFSYNQADELREIVRQHGGRLAAVVMEPTRSVLPAPGFLEDVRQLCDESGSRLIFDEVTTGFRLHRGGIHLQLRVTPDMAVFAKSLGNGHPIAAIIGNAATMDAAQESFISSTYWTEGVGPTAAVATLTQMQQVDVPAHVGQIGTLVRDGLNAIAASANVPLKLTGHPAQTYIGFDHPQSDALLTLFTLRMLAQGFLCGGAFYPTLAHDTYAVNAFLSAAEPAIAELATAITAGDVLTRIEGKVRHSGFKRLN